MTHISVQVVSLTVLTSDSRGKQPDGNWEGGICFSKSWQTFSTYGWGYKVASLVCAGLSTLLKQFPDKQFYLYHLDVNSWYWSLLTKVSNGSSGRIEVDNSFF